MIRAVIAITVWQIDVDVRNGNETIEVTELEIKKKKKKVGRNEKKWNYPKKIENE